MSEHLTTVGEMYDFLQLMKKKKVVSVRDLHPHEIKMAEQLVRCKLLSKIATKVTTHYTYGVDEIPKEENHG